MAIETAIVAPVLALLSVGAFQVSAMVARQNELQSAVAEAEAIALASPPDTAAERDTIRNIVGASVGPATEHPDARVTVAEKFRCNSDVSYVATAGSCPTTAEVSSFVEITITDTYTPMWRELGIGEPFHFNVVRTVQVS